jgi:uncharacterized membrane protein YeiB
MNQRIIGFDLARAYAIFGMYIVNFNFSFGSVMAPTGPAGRFLNLFTGNSTAIFIICAGMGVALMTNKSGLSPEEKEKLRSRVLKRSWFLFFLGLLLFNWWSGDILHFYGGYMHVAAFLLFVPKRYYLWGAFMAVLIFHLLLLLIPVTTSWDFSIFRYEDFWTLPGFLRNTFYNGWNSLFPWISYFFLGMWLGRLQWQDRNIRRSVFVTGLIVFLLLQGLRLLAKAQWFTPFWTDYILAEYFPPYLPFVLLTMAFAGMVIPVCMYIGEKYGGSKLVTALQQTGQMTLTHYVLHLTLGMIIFTGITGKQYTGFLEDQTPTRPLFILAYAVLFYLFSIVFSLLWRKKFRNGPLEMLMRWISG